MNTLLQIAINHPAQTLVLATMPNMAHRFSNDDQRRITRKLAAEFCWYLTTTGTIRQQKLSRKQTAIKIKEWISFYSRYNQEQP